LKPLFEILLLLAAMVLAVGLFQRARIPSSLGYLLVGALIGPHVLGLVASAESIRLDQERIAYWTGNGAQLSDTVARLVKQQGKVAA
jgi:hypothetical protein